MELYQSVLILAAPDHSDQFVGFGGINSALVVRAADLAG